MDNALGSLVGLEAIHAANLALASAQLRIARLRKAAEQRAQKVVSRG